MKRERTVRLFTVIIVQLRSIVNSYRLVHEYFICANNLRTDSTAVSDSEPYFYPPHSPRSYSDICCNDAPLVQVTAPTPVYVLQASLSQRKPYHCSDMNPSLILSKDTVISSTPLSIATPLEYIIKSLRTLDGLGTRRKHRFIDGTSNRTSLSSLHNGNNIISIRMSSNSRGRR